MWFHNDYPPCNICDKGSRISSRIISEAIHPFAVEARLNASEDVANRYEELLQTQILSINNNSI